MSGIWLGAALGLALMVLLTAALYALAPHAPATPRRVQSVRELDLYLDRLVASGNPPGWSAVVVRDGCIVYNRAFGYADGPRKIMATPDSVYH
jgi:CubicO group peptidase (beta-lactamase class C family)